MVVDGSPAWHVYRMVPLEVEGEELPKRQEALDVAPPPPPARARVQQTQQPTQQELDKKLSASFLEQVCVCMCVYACVCMCVAAAHLMHIRSLA